MSHGDNESIGYLGIPLSLDASKPNTQNIKISNQGKIWHQKIVLRSHAYPVEVIKLKPQKQGLVAPEKLNNESNIIGEFFKTFSNERLWTQSFLMPAKGRISSDFGFRRDYFVEKKRVSQWQHRGVDITAPIGTEIVSPANGRVILSENFESHGGTLMIDHGWGVVSIFNHLKTRLVKTGDMVNAGEKIASMGDSGIATGSNVHWGLSVNGVRVDPLQWTTPSPFGHSP
jgi:murein DD-endopeptidase MepM/ murein hydrolase activator NlpD